MNELGLAFDDKRSITQTSYIKTCIKLRTNKIIGHLNRYSVNSHGRKIDKTIGYNDNRLGTNRQTTKDSSGKDQHKYIRRQKYTHDELFQSFPNKVLWNSMCVKNNMVELQVFDENDKEESSVPEPIANVG